MNLWTVLLTGLTTGGLTCLAVQGGLLAGYLTNRRAEGQPQSAWRSAAVPTAAFLVGKLIAYTTVGAFLGALGSVFQLSLGLRVTLQLLAGAFMVLAALKLFGIRFPFASRLEFHPPPSIRRLLRSRAQSASAVTPFLLGLFTILIPCGTTQAMEVFAIASGSAVQGALILAVFTLGTVPLFFGIGVLAQGSLTLFRGTFARVAAALVLLLGLSTVNAALALTGSPYTAQNVARTYLAAVFGVGDEAVGATVTDGVQEVTIYVNSNGYSPKTIALQRGVPARIRLVTQGTQGCSRAFVVPKLKIQEVLPETGERVIEFTPTDAGPLAFSCSMGMFTGNFEVI